MPLLPIRVGIVNNFDLCGVFPNYVWSKGGVFVPPFVCVLFTLLICVDVVPTFIWSNCGQGPRALPNSLSFWLHKNSSFWKF